MEQANERALKALDDLERQVLRATQVIDELRRENATLRRQLDTRGSIDAQSHEAAVAMETDWRRLTAEREAIADRLRTILGKFQWLEGGMP